MFFCLLTTLSRSATAANLAPMVLDGRAQPAVLLALQGLEALGSARHGEAAVELATLAADLMLAQDCPEEAEDLYRQAVVAAAAAPRGQVRVVACRNTGFFSLYQRRYSAASNGFQRVADDAAATLSQQVEALAGLALVHHALGRGDMAAQSLDDAQARLDQASASPGDSARLAAMRLLVRVQRIDLAVLYALHTHAALEDHIFWRSEAVYAGTRREPADLLAELQACQGAAAGNCLLTQRLAHLVSLVRASAGQPRALALMHEYLAWLRRMHLTGAEREARIEGTLVAVVGQQADLARSLLEPFAGRATDGPQRWSFELSYCRAKLCEMTGQNEACLRHYQRYALESAMCLRSEAPMSSLTAALVKGRAAETHDEAELALPAKYRRAYRYLLAQMDRADLSVREIAEHVGVTERAVQAAFRQHLGMTPVEVLRRCRIERIRDDLLHTEGCGSTVIATAARWGIRSRSTLVSSYRKHFSETPTDTLARREAPLPPEAHGEVHV